MCSHFTLCCGRRWLAAHSLGTITGGQQHTPPPHPVFVFRLPWMTGSPNLAAAPVNVEAKRPAHLKPRHLTYFHFILRCAVFGNFLFRTINRSLPPLALSFRLLVASWRPTCCAAGRHGAAHRTLLSCASPVSNQSSSLALQIMPSELLHFVARGETGDAWKVVPLGMEASTDRSGAPAIVWTAPSCAAGGTA